MNNYDEQLKTLETKPSSIFKLDTGIKLNHNSKNVKQFFNPDNIKSGNRNFNFYYLFGTSLSFFFSPESFLTILGILFTYISLLAKKSKLETIHVPLLVSRSLVRYFLQIHIGINLKKLRELYLLEIITASKKQSNSKEIETFREIISDIEGYIAILPSTRKLFASIASIGVASFGLAQIMGINLNLINQIILFYNNEQIQFIMIMIFLYFIAFLISFPFKHAFKIKRMLLLKSNMFDYFNDYYPKEPNQLYQNSVYKIENELYQSIKNKNLKPLERSYDRIWATLLGIAIIIFGTSLLISVTYEQLISAEINTNLMIFVFFFSIILLIPIMQLVVNPYLIYKKRKNLNLL